MDFEDMKSLKHAKRLHQQRGLLQMVSAEDALRDLWRKYGRALLVLAFVVLLVHDVFGTHGFLAMRRTQSDIRRVQADLDRLDKENMDLQQQVKDLKTDPKLIEKIAREDLVLARPGEIIVKIPPSAAPVPAGKSRP
jgi:cell division protein FtsB